MYSDENTRTFSVSKNKIKKIKTLTLISQTKKNGSQEIYFYHKRPFSAHFEIKVIVWTEDNNYS